MGSRKGIPSWLAAVLVAIVALVWLATASFSLLDKSQFFSSEQLQPVSAGHEVIQTITAPTDTISRVDLILSKPAKGAEGNLRFQLVEVTGTEAGGELRLGEILREVNLDTASFDYTTRPSFEFDSLDVTPGRTYAIRLTSDDPGDAAVRPNGLSDENNLDGNFKYSGGRVYVDGKPTPADLHFGIFHDAGAGEMLEKIEPWRPFPLNQAWFIVAIFLIGAATFGWLLWVLAGGEVDGAADGAVDSGEDGGLPEGQDDDQAGMPTATIPPVASAGGKQPPAGPAVP